MATNGNDLLNGTDGNDSLNGLSGNDTINPGLGRDTVDGGSGSDILVLDYFASNDGGIYYSSTSLPASGTGFLRTYYGNHSVSFSNIERYDLTGSQGNDVLYGGNNNDTLNGGNGDDYIDAGTGTDVLDGGAGSDSINAGNGNDILIGVDSNSSNPGLGERDTLVGGLGSDKFILGDALWSAYDDRNSGTAGTTDYALITDFNPSDDVIQLKGSKSNYILGTSPIAGISGTGIFINQPGTEPDELIAVLQGVSNLNLSSNAFVAIPPTQTLDFSSPYFFVGEDGTSYIAVSLTRTGSSSGVVGATVNLSNGSAVAPDDYNNNPIIVSLLDGETTKIVSIPIVNDTVFEAAETINLSLSNPTGGATLGSQKTAVLRIVDNDSQPSTLAFSASNFSVNENGTQVAAVTVNRTGSSIGTTSATLNFLLGGTATPTTDFNATPVTVNFANGQASKTVTIPVVNDTLFEGNETISLVLTNPTNGANIGAISTATLTIVSDDPLNGTAGNDNLTGYASNDTINGLAGNDTINGGDGNDTLTGAGTDNGVNSIDTLTGGNGSDLFVLSNSTTVFYNDNNSSNAGLTNYALIKDFNSSQDKIQLEGSASRYLLNSSSPISGVFGTAIYLDNATDELIAVVQGSSGLNLTATYFAYV